MLVAYLDDAITHVPIVEKACALLAEDLGCRVECEHVLPGGEGKGLFLDDDGIARPPSREVGRNMVLSRSRVDALSKRKDALFLLDVDYDHADLRYYGLQVARYLVRASVDERRIILLTGWEGRANEQVEAGMSKGWFDCCNKSVLNGDPDKASEVLRARLLLLARDAWQNALNADDLARRPAVMQEMHCVSSEMQWVAKCALTAARSMIRVLIQGEPGTGKEYLARFVHAHSARSRYNFVRVSGAEFHKAFLGRTTFQYDQNAPQMVVGIPGWLEEAEKGTLFVDEVGEVPLEQQARILRFFQDLEYPQLGSNTIHKAELQLITTTSADLASLVAQGRLRDELGSYLRTAFFAIKVPALRERIEDVGPLGGALVQEIAPAESLILSDDAVTSLKDQAWPGNIADLRGALERAIELARARGEPIKPNHFSFASQPVDAEGSPTRSSASAKSFEVLFQEVLHWKGKHPYVKFLAAFGALVKQLSASGASKDDPRCNLAYRTLRGAMQCMAKDPGWVNDRDGPESLACRKLAMLLRVVDNVPEYEKVISNVIEAIGWSRSSFPPWEDFCKNFGESDPKESWPGERILGLGKVLEAFHGDHAKASAGT